MDLCTTGLMVLYCLQEQQQQKRSKSTCCPTAFDNVLIDISVRPFTDFKHGQDKINSQNYTMELNQIYIKML